MSSLTLQFRHDGEEAIVLKALTDAYARVLAQVEELRAACTSDDLAGLMTLADITDHAEERRQKLSRRWDRVRARIEQEDDEAGEVLEAEPPTDMAHGCAAFSPAIGLALRAGQDGAATPSADPAFSRPEGQDLPAVVAADKTQSRVGGGHSHAISI